MNVFRGLPGSGIIAADFCKGNPSVKKLAVLTVLALALTGCFPWLYKLDIQQGNLLDRDKLTQLQIGMTTQQVRYLLGTPAIADTFNPDRWIYYYSLRDGKDNFRQEEVTLYFQNGALAKIDNQIPADSPPPIVSTNQSKLAEPDPDAKKTR